MKIVKFKAGFGNQLFQYAFAIYLKNKFPEETVKIDYTWIDNWYKKKSKDFVFLSNIEKLNAIIDRASTEDLKKTLILQNNKHPRSVLYKVILILENMFNKKYFFEKNRAYVDFIKLKKHDYFDGYFQSYKYLENIEDELRNDLKYKNNLSENAEKMLEKIEASNSVFIGIRLGDYEKRKNHYSNW
jgi:hypothetical protein